MKKQPFVRVFPAKLTIIPQEMNLQYAVYFILLLETQLPQLSGLSTELAFISSILEDICLQVHSDANYSGSKQYAESARTNC